MHSSRMRTGRSLTVCGGGSALEVGWAACSWGVSDLGGVSALGSDVLVFVSALGGVCSWGVSALGQICKIGGAAFGGMALWGVYPSMH